jgi:hypothetical protein
MRRLVFLLLVVLLFGFNYGCSKKNSKKNVSEITVDDCKKRCSAVNNSSEFCKRICEKEIFDPRWKVLALDGFGDVWFYGPKSISTSGNIVKV